MVEHVARLAEIAGGVGLVRVSPFSRWGDAGAEQMFYSIGGNMEQYNGGLDQSR
jgi:hypothetical protein